MRAYNVTVAEVANAVRQQNMEMPGGRVDQGTQELSVRTMGRINDVEDFKRIILTDRGQRAARAMRDIVREVETEWEQQLGPDRFAQLRLLLSDLNDHVAGEPPRADAQPTRRAPT